MKVLGAAVAGTTLVTGASITALVGNNKVPCEVIQNFSTLPARPEVEILQFTPEDPLLAVRPHTHTSNDWQLDFDTHKAIVDTFTEAGYPVPEMRTAQRAIQAAATSVANAGKA